MKLVYIVGTNHNYQLGVDVAPSRITAFEQMLCQKIKEHQIVGIAEEMTIDVMKLFGVEASIPYKVSQQLGLLHRYCDADKATKAALGITSNIDPKRERFWLDQLATSFSKFPVLFICGSMHCRRFNALLAASGYDAKILHRNWPNSPDCRMGEPISNAPTAPA